MSAPTGSDASTDSGESTRETLHDADDGAGDDGTSLLDTATDWARHWKAWSVVVLSLAVVAWSIRRPELSPKGYIPIFVGLAVVTVGYVYLDEETQFHFASG